MLTNVRVVLASCIAEKFAFVRRDNSQSYVQAGAVDEDPGGVGHVHEAGQGGTPAGLAPHPRHRGPRFAKKFDLVKIRYWKLASLFYYYTINVLCEISVLGYIVSEKINSIFGYSVFQISKSKVKNAALVA